MERLWYSPAATSGSIHNAIVEIVTLEDTPLIGVTQSYSCSLDKSLISAMKCVISSGTIASATRPRFRRCSTACNETRPSQDKDDEQEVFYTTALAQDQADGYVLTGHPVMLQGGEYVMFTYEGLGTGVQEFILTVYGTCMPMLNLTRRKGQDIERYYPAEDAKAGDRPINLRCELLIPIRR
ncbi:GyrI-like domain-containing protein [Shigella flexneri]